MYYQLEPYRHLGLRPCWVSSGSRGNYTQSAGVYRPRRQGQHFLCTVHCSRRPLKQLQVHLQGSAKTEREGTTIAERGGEARRTPIKELQNTSPFAHGKCIESSLSRHVCQESQGRKNVRCSWFPSHWGGKGTTTPSLQGESAGHRRATQRCCLVKH